MKNERDWLILLLIVAIVISVATSTWLYCEITDQEAEGLERIEENVGSISEDTEAIREFLEESIIKTIEE